MPILEVKKSFLMLSVDLTTMLNFSKILLVDDFLKIFPYIGMKKKFLGQKYKE